MGISKNLLKKSKLYKFFNYNFSNIQSRLEKLEEHLQTITNNNIDKSILDNITKEITSLKTISNKSLSLIENNSNKINLIENRTQQFDYINSELLLLNKTLNQEKILIVGFYGAPNSGDELMLQSILNKIDSDRCSITVMLADNPNYKLPDYKTINYIHYPKTNMDFNIIANYFDKIVFGGGAIIEDTYLNDENSYKFNMGSILLNLSMACINNNKKIYCVGLSTSTAITNQNYIKSLDFIIEHSEHFSLRDSNSLQTLKNCNIKNIGKIQLIPDLVFSLKEIPYDFNLINCSENFVIGLVLIGFSDHNKLRDIISWIDQYSNEFNKPIKIKLIPFYDFCHSDIVNLNAIINTMELHNPIEIVPYSQQYEDIMEIFHSCNMIINMRYHSTLLCLKTGIPAINIIYDIHPHYENKMNYLMETYNLPHLFLSYNNLNKKLFYDSIKYLIKNIRDIYLIETTISKKIQKNALTEHSKIINNILGLKENYEI